MKDDELQLILTLTLTLTLTLPLTKVGPSMKDDELQELVKILNPDKIEV